MWKSISQVLADQFGAYYGIKQKCKLHSGEMHENWLISDGIQQVFVKCNEKSFRSMFRAEADQLTLLARTNTLALPRVYAVGGSQNHSFLLLEGLDLNKNMYSKEAMRNFGVQLARLHSIHDCEQYGLDFDTWLGPVYQPNQWKNNWASFFAEQRIGWQLQLCKEKHIEFGHIDEIIQQVKQRLLKHNPKPSLLHGNFWIENCGEVQDQIVTYDPACYWGDREIDIAFSELFEPFPTEFYQGYQSVYPLDKGYPERKTIYWLYYLLNFSHRYKGHYLHLTEKIIQDFI